MTIDYYNRFAEIFVKGTIDADLSELRDRFLDHLPDGAHILDLGCGSGRDVKAFLDKGYKVTAIDGSSACCKLAKETIGQDVLCMTFDELAFVQAFDGVWACASLLHVPYAELPGVFERIAETLKTDGILYASFKYGDFEGERNGRYFTDLTEERLMTLFKPTHCYEIIETFVTVDVRNDRDSVKWLNVIVRKQI